MICLLNELVVSTDDPTCLIVANPRKSLPITAGHTESQQIFQIWLALEQTNEFVMHGLITVDEASKMNCVDITMALSKDGLKSKRHVL